MLNNNTKNQDEKVKVVESLDGGLGLDEDQVKQEPEGEDSAEKAEPEEEDIKDAEEGTKGTPADDS